MKLRRSNYLAKDAQAYSLDISQGQARIVPIDLMIVPKHTLADIVQGPIFVLDGRGQTHMVVRIEFTVPTSQTDQAWILASTMELLLADK